MRLFVLTPHYTTFVKGLTDALARYVSDVNVFVVHNPVADLAEYMLRFVDLSFLRHAARISRRNIVDVVGSPENVDIHMLSIPYILPVSRNLMLGRRIAWRLRRRLRVLNVDILHCHFAYPQGYACVNAVTAFDRPVVVHAHGFDVYSLPFKGVYGLICLEKSIASAIMCLSPARKPRKFLLMSWVLAHLRSA